MSLVSRKLAKEAQDEIIFQAARPRIENFEKEILSEQQESLASLIEEERQKLRQSSPSIAESAKDIASLSLQIERQNSLFGHKRGSNYYVAARLYAQGRRTSEIVKETGIPAKELTKLINHRTRGWKLQRDRIFETINRDLKKENLPVLRRLSQMGLGLIEKAFEERLRSIEDVENPKPVTLSEATQVATIMAFVVKEKRLDEDSGHGAEKSFTPTEIFKRFAEDPYIGPAFKKMVKDSVPIEVVVDGVES